MILQASDVFFGWSTKLQGEELDVSPDAGDERHSHGGEDRIELGTRGLWFAVQGLVDIIIYDVALARHKLLRLLSTNIYIVGFGILIVANRALAIDTVADDYGNLISANIAYSLSLSAHRTEPVELGASLARNQQLPLLLSDIIHQMAGYRNLCGRFLAQTYTHGIADTIGQKGTDAHSTLDSSVLAFTSLSNAQMQRIAHAFFLHLADQEAHRANHHYGIGRLDADDHIVEILFLADAEELHTALYDAFGSIAIAVADAVGQRAMVHADADGCMILLADIEEWNESVFYLLQFVSIFLIGIFLLDELAGRINIVARIDTHLLAVESSNVGNVRIEVNISYKRCQIAVGTNAGIDVLHVLCLP